MLRKLFHQKLILKFHISCLLKILHLPQVLGYIILQLLPPLSCSILQKYKMYSKQVNTKSILVGQLYFSNFLIFCKFIYMIKNKSVLDVTMHCLNDSPTKQKFSFCKSPRFKQSWKNISPMFYNLPDYKSKRAPSFGLGQKLLTEGVGRKTPSPFHYNVNNIKLKNNKSYSFGIGRDKVSNGLLSQIQSKSFLPGPGQYQTKIKENSGFIPITFKSRLPDLQMKQLSKNPAPGNYQLESFGTEKYYINSKYKNSTNFKILPYSKRLNSIKNDNKIGPGKYNIDQSSISPTGRYILSKDQASKSQKFSKGERQFSLLKHQLKTPGPLSYRSFSVFG